MNTMFAAILGGWEWVIVILAVLLLFGAKKIPELARGLGTGIAVAKPGRSGRDPAPLTDLDWA